MLSVTTFLKKSSLAVLGCHTYLDYLQLFFISVEHIVSSIDMRSGLPASQDRSERTASLAASTGGRAALITRGVRQVTKRALHVR